MGRVVVVGGGWSGCAASVAAKKQNLDVVLIERTDMLLGTGLAGGIMRNNGRFTAAEEMIAMSGGELFQLIDRNSIHPEVEFPGHRHSSLYNVGTMEPIVRGYLLRNGIFLQLRTRVEDVEMDGSLIRAVRGKVNGRSVRFEGDVFVDATGTAGPPANCSRYGNGCAMCILRCYSFGGRLSVTAMAGIRELAGGSAQRLGAISGSCLIMKDSLSKEIVQRLNRDGVVVIKVPSSVRAKKEELVQACQQYALPEYEDNIILLDAGHAKLMAPFYPLELLRQIPGCENARYEDPYAGGLGNSIRLIGIAPRDDSLRVKGVENLFCCGEKSGLMVGHTEAIVTGTLAGYNASRYTLGRPPLILPETLAVGDIISYVGERMKSDEGLLHKYTFSGSVYFERMKEKGLYTTDVREITERVRQAGLSGIFGR